MKLRLDSILGCSLALILAAGLAIAFAERPVCCATLGITPGLSAQPITQTTTTPTRAPRLSMPLLAGAQPSPIPTIQPGGTPTTGTPPPTGTPAFGTPPPVTVTPNPSWVPEPPVGPNDVKITYIQVFDPEFPNDPDEYVEIENRFGQNITFTGWQLRNASRANLTPYIFPQYVLEEDTTVVVYSHAGTDDLEVGDFFWGQTPPLWQVGDRAELLDAAGRLIDAYVVEEQ